MFELGLADTKASHFVSDSCEGMHWSEGALLQPLSYNWRLDQTVGLHKMSSLGHLDPYKTWSVNYMKYLTAFQIWAQFFPMYLNILKWVSSGYFDEKDTQ